MSSTALSSPTADRYADWKAPREDGSMLIWPEPKRLVEETHENHRRLSTSDLSLLQNVPLSKVRESARAFVGHRTDAPLIVTGHQTELHHAGVWVKNVVIDAIANATGGAAYHLAVDTDSPKHLTLRWPGGSEPITDDPDLLTAAWSGLLQPPTPAHLKEVDAKLARDAATWPFRPMAGDVLATLRRSILEEKPLPDTLTNALHELDWSLGLRHTALLASPIWSSEAFLLFTHHVLARACQFARDYNAALADYRRETGTTSPMRPMPDLFIGGEGIEVPFWLDNLSTGERRRPSVFRDDDETRGTGYILELLDGQQFRFDPTSDGFEAAAELSKWLRQTNHRLAPRALTLTMFMRLCVVDQFVHGIGGGRYDQVTDRIFAGHFKIEPPKFSVATATLYFPTAVGRDRACLPCLLQEGHQLKHAVLGERKMELVKTIASLPRDSSDRARAFFDLHAALRAARTDNAPLRDWESRLKSAQEQSQEDQTVFDRELFYALQPEDRLMMLIERVGAAFA